MASRSDENAIDPSVYRQLLDAPVTEVVVSTASLWEIGIKMRLGKLHLQIPLADLPLHIEAAGVSIRDVTAEHALHEARPVPSTRDPFDRLLLAVADVEGAKLLTVDQHLLDHPLAWRPPSA